MRYVMNYSDNYYKVKNAMLCFQRQSWEQGVCAQALFEAGDLDFINLATDAVQRQSDDGRLAVVGENVAVTDPAANGEAVYRAFEHTEDDIYMDAVSKMLAYLMVDAPRTSKGLICHNEVSFEAGFSAKQIWADSIYMLPPFLAVVGEFAEAQKQLDGYLDRLSDLGTNRLGTGLLYHIYDSEQKTYVRQKLWATGNGWALLGIARMIALCNNNLVVKSKYVQKGKKLLDAMLEFQCESGMFHDILDEPDTFEDATSAMMAATFVYRGIVEGWLHGDESGYCAKADKIYEAVQSRIDERGIIRGVCGAPHFRSEGTSAEAQAVYIMLEAWRNRCNAA
jgi:rhamnogalacturonyl hydrolase YesR